ncbi:hypothetical protein F5Y02DRAFT_97479 [Annulohypoxylon stygium]|nr:hypothetical protein F5Y02DRAFT_97479 [Annulohypoxylon stygium]
MSTLRAALRDGRNPADMARSHTRFPVRRSQDIPIPPGQPPIRNSPQPDDNNAIIVYNPQDYDVVMSNAPDINQFTDIQIRNPPAYLVELHQRMFDTYHAVQSLASSIDAERLQDQTNIRKQYETMVDVYHTAVVMNRNGLEASADQIAHFKNQVQQASAEFSQQVWGAIARFAETEERRNEAVNKLTEVASYHEKALDALHVDLKAQKDLQSQIVDWAHKKESQIEDLLSREYRDPNHIEEDTRKQINDVRAYTQRVLDEFNAQLAANKVADVNSVLESIALLKDQVRRTADAAKVQFEATRVGPFMTPAIGGGGGRIPPRNTSAPPDPNPDDSGDDDNDPDDFGRRPYSGNPRPPPPPRGNRDSGAGDGPPPGSSDDRLLRALEKLIRPGPVTSVVTNPVHLNKPSTYDGKDLSKFRAWWMKVDAYLQTYADSFKEDLPRINWVGSLLTDKAQLWHQQRATAIKNSKQIIGGIIYTRVDSWDQYVGALHERFSDPSERHRNAKKMTELKYQGDIDQYLTELLDLNEAVKWSGTTFQNHIAKTLPDDITRLVYSRQGEVPETDDEFVQAIRGAGRIYENMLTNPGISSVKGEPTSTTERSKSGQQDRGRNRSNPGSDRSSKNTGQSKPPGNSKPDTKDKRWSTNKEALKGIDQADIDQRKKDKKPCWRCGRDNHQTLACFAKKDVNGKELPAAPDKVSAAKRPREEDLKDTPPQKKAKIDSAMREASRPQFMEINEDSESDF